MNALGQPIHNAKRYGDKYFAYIDVFHQLHCLDLVRKYIFRDYYHSYIAFQDTEEQIFFHVGKKFCIFPFTRDNANLFCDIRPLHGHNSTEDDGEKLFCTPGYEDLILGTV